MIWTQYTTWGLLWLVAQIIFVAGFVVQWIASERKGKSIVPVHFWILSLCGGGILLVYAIHRRDPVLVVGQVLVFFVCVRNLMLLIKERNKRNKCVEDE